MIVTVIQFTQKSLYIKVLCHQLFFHCFTKTVFINWWKPQTLLIIIRRFYRFFHRRRIFRYRSFNFNIPIKSICKCLYDKMDCTFCKNHIQCTLCLFHMKFSITCLTVYEQRRYIFIQCNRKHLFLFPHFRCIIHKNRKKTVLLQKNICSKLLNNLLYNTSGRSVFAWLWLAY